MKHIIAAITLMLSVVAQADSRRVVVVSPERLKQLAPMINSQSKWSVDMRDTNAPVSNEEITPKMVGEIILVVRQKDVAKLIEQPTKKLIQTDDLEAEYASESTLKPFDQHLMDHMLTDAGTRAAKQYTVEAYKPAASQAAR